MGTIVGPSSVGGGAYEGFDVDAVHLVGLAVELEEEGGGSFDIVCDSAHLHVFAGGARTYRGRTCGHASYAFHEQLGFVREGVLRDNVFTQGKRSDELIFGLTAPEFRARYPRSDTTGRQVG